MSPLAACRTVMGPSKVTSRRHWHTVTWRDELLYGRTDGLASYNDLFSMALLRRKQHFTLSVQSKQLVTILFISFDCIALFCPQPLHKRSLQRLTRASRLPFLQFKLIPNTGIPLVDQSRHFCTLVHGVYIIHRHRFHLLMFLVDNQFVTSYF